ncbi:peptidase M17 [Mucilaginibacter sp. BJC16-A38]|uniref:M17 family peptidase N-terminal domain-containing protein n=1 Tax=Mucilaginibacter phenanthrenivorans TaxID=1234842 RepID=UPI002157A05C|nr:M17 family peptidase N-terminal domain-containing protein [Mucilaginibacter phenanthrenivorans]MCR8556532.1 peptidase M17 [Mucilaginibacter phenanthrenivorans]
MIKLFTSTGKPRQQNFRITFSAFLLLITVNTHLWAQNTAPRLADVGTTAVLGKADGIVFEAKVQSPSDQATPLQIICIFEYTEGDMTGPQALPAAANGLLHVDQALNGLITMLRKSEKFAGHALETLLIIPPKGTMPAQKILLIGLGNRDQFNPEIMTSVGRVGMREALRLGVSSYSHASDLKDAGINSPTGAVAVNVVKGALDAYETEEFLVKKKVTTHKPLTKITILAGQPFFAPTGDAIKAYLSIKN